MVELATVHRDKLPVIAWVMFSGCRRIPRRVFKPLASNFKSDIRHYKMKPSQTGLILFTTALILLLALGQPAVLAADFQLISTTDGSASASANGDSGNPVFSADGRYIAFSSSANNLVLTNSAGPVPNTRPQYQNVFLRDRLSGSNFLVSVNLAGNG